MKIAIMQPYFLPYIGYWQLMNTVDSFVILDDVNYINRGWINRNRIIHKQNNRYIHLPLLKASQNKHIDEILVNNEEKEINRNVFLIREAYRKAPYYEESFPIVELIYGSKKKFASDYIVNSLEIINEYLSIKTRLCFSSVIEPGRNYAGEERIIEICQRIGAQEYINPIGGVNLYHKERFESNGISLGFLKSRLTPYKQFNEEFVPSLSIIDVLMFCGRERTKDMLQDYDIIY